MPCEPPARCVACAAHGLALCRDLGVDQLVALHAIARRRVLFTRQALYRAGDAGFVCANVTSGVLQVQRDEAGGRDQIVGLLFPGDFAGDPFAPAAPDTVLALSEATLCIYPRAALMRALEAHPEIGRLLLRRTFATLASTRRSLAMLAYGRAEARLAAFLLDMAERAGCGADGAGARFQLPLSRSAMAEALGLAPETVSRAMSMLRAAKLVATQGHRGVQLLDRGGLAALLA